jgi:hypothetical protein
MNFLFFISLIAVATANTASIPLTKLLRNPKLFASAFAHADGDAVNKMIALVDKLISDGEAAKDFAIQDHTQKTDSHNAAVTALKEAEAALATASGNADVATTKRDNLVVKEQADRDALSAAVNALGDATTLESVTNGHWEETSTRVAAEQESFGKIIDLLQSVSVEGRRLLSVDEADPGAVGIVVAKVQALLETAQDELDASVAAHDAAKTELATRTDEEAAARALHTATAGELAAAKKNVENLNIIKRTKTDDRDAASAAEADAETALAHALAFKDSELARISQEDATLKEARNLLANING